MYYLLPNALYDGKKLLTDVVLACDEDIVVDLLPRSKIPEGASVEHVDAVISPGLFDVQVNGGGGVMLNNSPTREAVRQIAEAHAGEGTAYTLPTVITDRAEVMERAALAVQAEYQKNGVLGIHIEGPHINVAHKGTHNPELIRPFDERTMAVLECLRLNDIPVLLTLAPETVEPGLIAKLTKMGVVVSAGHTAATAEQTKRALAEGLRCFTHLFNGMPQMTSRAPMITGAAINSDVWCGIIADGHHVDYDMVGLAIRARPVPDRMVLVSDAMSTVGGPDHFELYGDTIRVQEGRLVNKMGSLAGAHINLADSIIRLSKGASVPLGDAIRMAALNPFELMNIKRPDLIGAKVKSLGRLDVAKREIAILSKV